MWNGFKKQQQNRKEKPKILTWMYKIVRGRSLFIIWTNKHTHTHTYNRRMWPCKISQSRWEAYTLTPLNTHSFQLIHILYTFILVSIENCFQNGEICCGFFVFPFVWLVVAVCIQSTKVARTQECNGGETEILKGEEQKTNSCKSRPLCKRSEKPPCVLTYCITSSCVKMKTTYSKYRWRG